MPSRKRLHTDQPHPAIWVRLGFHQRLVPDPNARIAYGLGQPRLDVELLLAHVLAAHVVQQLEIVASLRLGMEHGPIRLRQQCINVSGVLIFGVHGNPHAECHVDGYPIQRDGLVHPIDHFLCHLAGSIHGFQVG